MEPENELLVELKQHIEKAKESFPYFLEHIFPLSYKKAQIVKAPHTFKWGERVQNNKKTATLSARKHLKSTTIYAWVMWRIYRLKKDERENWDYMSYTQPMSAYHTENIKELIQSNPLFESIEDLTAGRTQLNYTWNGTNRFIVEPQGILTFNRGRHPYGVICDDILQDPTTPLNLTMVDKINRIFFEQVMSLPKEGGELHLVGTAQHAQDLFFQLKNNKAWDWAEYKAIINEANKEVLWPELFSYERLREIRDLEIGEKAFMKEYMCSPVWSEDAYFKRDEIIDVVGYVHEGKRYHIKEEKRPAGQWKGGSIIAGVDIGKKAHPSHIAIFHILHGKSTMIYEKFLDGWDYTKQIELLEGLRDFYLIDEIRYDNTRGEFEYAMEQGLINARWWKPFIFTNKSKFEIASNFSKHVNNKTVVLLNRQRMLDSILSVNNELKAPETSIGHGDAFWSVALALYEPIKGGGYMAG